MIAFNEITTLFVSPDGRDPMSGTERTPSSAGAPFPSRLCPQDTSTPGYGALNAALEGRNSSAVT